MSAPVNVLAVLDDLIADMGDTPGTTGHQVAQARAAVADLIEALEEAVACGMVPKSSALEGGASRHIRQVRCADMIRAALAKATGGRP